MATKHYKASKPNRIDPTRTVMVRKRFVMELRRRFARLRGEIVQLLLDDVFGIRRRMIKDVTVRNIFCPTGEGGGVDPSCSPEAQEAVAWVYAQDPWRDKVTTEEKTVAGKDIRPAPGIAIVKRTVAKYEKLIEKENAITRRIVVAQDEDGKYFIHDGNHYFRALINLKKAGKLQHVKELPVVVVKPKGGYRFETKEIAGGYYHQLVANVFCPTGPGGGIDPSCSKDGGGSSSVSSGKDSAKLELAKLKKTAVQKSAPPSNGETFDQVTKRLPETMAKQVRSKFYLAQTVVFESMDELRKSGKVHDTDHAEASYDRSTRTLYLAKDSSESAIAHEIGHILDGPSRHITSDPQFVRTARKEAKNLSEYAQTSPEEALAEYLRIQFEEGHKAAAKKAPGMTKALIKKGYKDITQVGARVTNAADDWQFKTNSNQVKAFQQWLRERFGYHLSIKQLMKKFAEEGYKRGIGRAFDDVEKPYAQGYALDESTGDFYKPSKMQFLKSAFASPVGKERVEQLASRSFDDLKNVTGDMATRMSRTLLEGLVDGSHPNKIAKSLSKDLDISLSRAETIARTEIIRAHAEGQLDAMQAMGVAEVGVQVEWITAQDDAVCPRCEAMEGVILEIEKAHNMIPMHPNCRCAFMPAGDVLQPRSVEDAAEAGRDSVDNLAAIFNAFYPTGEGGGVDPIGTIEQLINVFCPTGPGGGIDPTCSAGGSGGLAQAPKADPANQVAASTLIEKLQSYKTKTSPARVKQLVDALKKLTVAQLKAIKEKYEVDAKGGKKAELVDRLTARLKEKIDSTIKSNRLAAPVKPPAPPAVAQKKDYIAELPKDATTDQRLDAVEKYVAENHPTDLTPLEQTRLNEIKELLSKQGRSQAVKYGKLRVEFNQLLAARYERQMKEAQHKTGARQSLLRAMQVDHPADIRIGAAVPYSQSQGAYVPGAPYKPTTEAEKLAMDRATQFVSALTAQSTEDDPLQFMFYKHASDGRAHQRGQKFINVGTSATNAGVLVHEMGHAIENQKPGALEACREFLLSRAANEKPQSIWGNSKEYGVEDDFKKAFGYSARYVGKTYPNGPDMSIKDATDTEVLSMGIQKLYDDPVGFIKNDRQYARLIIDILRDRTPRGFAMPIVPEPL